MARIIIAEDDRLTQAMYKKAIDFLGHEPVICSNGLEAVNEFKQNSADLVILDNMMPEMNGIEACRQIRSLPKGPGVPILFVSSLDEEEDIVKGINAGANDYLLKPIKDSHLFAKLKIFLRMSSLHRNDFELAKNHVVFCDKYRIIKILGYGTHSIVFLAEAVKDGNRKIALKLFKQTPDAEQIFESFVETAEKLKRINSPYILKMHEFGQSDGRLFVAMDFAPDGDLGKKVKGGKRISQREALKLGRDIAAGIKSIASEGIIHFDIKPENIMISPEGNYLLGDFGIVTTRSGTTIPIRREIWATLAYMSPEYFNDEKLYLEKSDIYSLGVTIYQALSGENPFMSDRPGTAMFCQLNLVPPKLTTLNQEFNHILSDTLAAMLSKRSDLRPGAQEIENRFTQILKLLQNDPSLDRMLDIKKDDQGKSPFHTGESYAENGNASEAKTGEKSMVSGETQEIKNTSSATFGKESDQESGGSSANGEKGPAQPGIIAKLFALVKQSCLPNKTAFNVFLLVILLPALIFAIVKTVNLVRELTSNPNSAPIGALTVTRCTKCGNIEEKNIVDISSDKCSVCGGQTGTAWKCADCGETFSVTPSAIDDKSGAEFKCPKCASLKTSPLPTSKEYIEALKK